MTVFITAGFSNLGSAIAKAFADRGDEVFVSSRTEKAHPYGKCIAMDLSDPASVGDAVSGFDRLDVLVNNAGIFTEGSQETLDESDFDAVFDVNVKGLFRITRAFLPLLRKCNGSVVNISSMNALHPGFGNTAHYDASKGAVSAYTRSLASETGLRINAIAPGLISAERLIGSPLEKRFSEHSVAKRMVMPDEIAALAVFLSTSTGIYGQTIAIDNGYLLL
ncbi:MAG: SDR family oxidoreductase [Candidatus Ornithospirochaeta sp.]|nr:SDR family oxidoreductase [Candidatus Ornithospirochaeta sp.]